MTRISKRPLRKDLEKRMFHIFWQAFAQLNNEHDVFEFLEDLLSPAEKIMLAKRLAIAILLEKSWGYDEISSTLKVSSTTVNNVRQKTSILGKGFSRVIKNILKKEEVASFFEELFEGVTSLIAPVGKVGLGPALRNVAREHHKRQKKKRNML